MWVAACRAADATNVVSFFGSAAINATYLLVRQPGVQWGAAEQVIRFPPGTERSRISGASCRPASCGAWDSLTCHDAP